MLLLSGGAGAVKTGSPSLQSEPHDAITTDNTLAIGKTLFSTYLFPFEVASLVLLVAMIGAIVLAKRDIGEHDA
jgi:NADH-quinone oxidoreductase subunit J